MATRSRQEALAALGGGGAWELLNKADFSDIAAFPYAKDLAAGDELDDGWIAWSVANGNITNETQTFTSFGLVPGSGIVTVTSGIEDLLPRMDIPSLAALIPDYDPTDRYFLVWKGYDDISNSDHNYWGPVWESTIAGNLHSAFHNYGALGVAGDGGLRSTVQGSDLGYSQSGFTVARSARRYLGQVHCGHDFRSYHSADGPWPASPREMTWNTRCGSGNYHSATEKWPDVALALLFGAQWAGLGHTTVWEGYALYRQAMP